MRQLLFNAEPQACFPSSHYEELPDFRTGCGYFRTTSKWL